MASTTDSDAPDPARTAPETTEPAEETPELDPETRKRLEREAETLFAATRRQLLLLIFTGFFLMLTLSVPDSQLVRADASIRWPLIQTQIQLSTFVTYAPLALVALLGYLHLLFGRLQRLRRDGFAPPDFDILSMASPSSRLLAVALLYVFVPFVLAWFSWKVVFRDEARMLIAATFIVSFGCALLYHRRANDLSKGWAAHARRAVIGVFAVLSVLGILLTLPWGDIRRVAPGFLPQADWRDPLMRLRMLDLKRANLGSADEFAIVNLALQNLSHADARFARLVGADLRDSNLTQANFRYALIGSEGSGTSLVTDFERATLDRAQLEEADLRNTHFDHASLIGADLEQAILGDTRFWCADLTDARMNRITGSSGDLIFQHARLDGALLGRAELVRPNFRFASLAGADLELATIDAGQFGFADLSGARMGNVSLRDASFLEASLREADLSYANLEGADFSGADLTGTNLTGAYGFDMAHLESRANLCGTLDPQGNIRNDHCPVESEADEPFVGASGEASAAGQPPPPCERTENTGTTSFLFRLQSVIAGADAPEEPSP